MKETPENIEILKKLGFEMDKTGWFALKDNGWCFIADCMPNFKILLKRLINSHYNDGYNDAKNNKPRCYKPLNGYFYE